MADPIYIALAVAVSAGVTWALRAAPFAVLAPLRQSQALAFVGLHMPVGIMLILALYTLRDVEIAQAGSSIPALVGVAATAGAHLWRRNMTLSIFAGTGAFVALSALMG